MAYNGPSSGSLNVIPLSSIATRGSTKPTGDTGSDGDYALDVNSGLLYGPKDASNTGYPWPVAGSIGQGLIWRSTFLIVATYNPGDIVSDSGNQYLCIKPLVLYPQTNVTQYTQGSWTPGDTVTTTDATINGLYMCVSPTNLTPSNPALQSLPAASQPWLLYSPSKDWTAVTGSGTFAQNSGALGNWIKLDSTIGVNPTGLSDGDYCSLSVRDTSITEAKLADSSVTSAKIVNGTITDVDLASSAVTTAKLADSSVTSAKIVNGTIATADIANGAITQPLLSTEAVGEGNISPYLTTATASPSAYFPATKIVSASTTASGTSISTTNPALDAASAMIERSNGMWLYPWNLGNSVAATSAATRFTRFRANRPLTIKSMAVIIVSASTNAETLQFGLYDSAGNRLVSSGNATLYTTAGGSTTTTTTSTGVKYAVLNGSTGYTLTAGSEYYAAFAYTYTSGTGITFTQAASVGTTNAFQLFGTTVGLYDAASQAVSTLPSTMGSAGATSIQPTFALLTV